MAWDGTLCFSFSLLVDHHFFFLFFPDLGGLDIHLQYLPRRCAPSLFSRSPRTTRAIILSVYRFGRHPSTLGDVSPKACVLSLFCLFCSSTSFLFPCFLLFSFNFALLVCMCVDSFLSYCLFFILSMKTPCPHDCIWYRQN